MIWIVLVPIVLLLIGFADMPIGYYTLIRIVVCLVGLLFSYDCYKSDEKVGLGTISYGLMAIIFNPLIPIYLDRGIWTVLDIIAIIMIGARYFQYENK